ncbi:MAG: VWA domain-containing protein, partial [Bacteroidetes bacterium]
DLLVSGFNDDDGGEDRGAAWLLFPGPVPEEAPEIPALAHVDESDLHRLYAGAVTAEDSARIDSLYDLTAYAPNNLVFLLDISASMNHSDKLPVLRDAFSDLLYFMRPEDKISVITYSGKPNLLIDALPATEREQIAGLLNNLKSLGETRPGPALEMAYEQARLHFIPDGNNRIILATDGSFPLSDIDKPLEKMAGEDVPLSVFYFGKQPRWKLDEMVQIGRRGFGRSAHITAETVQAELLSEVKQIRLKVAPVSEED